MSTKPYDFGNSEIRLERDNASEGLTLDSSSIAEASQRPAALGVRDLHKIYGKEVYALRGIMLEIREGEFVTLLGPSGSGKTTLLMVIAGFESPAHGRVLAAGVDITLVPPERRNFGVVFQNYALFPHMSVRQNVAYPLAARHIRGDERGSLVDRALALVDLEGLGDRRPGQLSGGQQQRVALARALVYRPSVLLLDEPLGALDRALRERMQIELRTLHQRVGVTFLYVTHDQDEALTMSDRVVVLRDGKIEQLGTPQDIYRRPATKFVATFVGSANLLHGSVIGSKGVFASVQLELGPTIDVPSNRVQGQGSNALVVVRPENVRVEPTTEPLRGDELSLEGHLSREVFAGSMWRYEVSTGNERIQAHMSRPVSARIGDSVRVRWHAAESWLVPIEGS